jgi:hypothetical protein
MSKLGNKIYKSIGQIGNKYQSMSTKIGDKTNNIIKKLSDFETIGWIYRKLDETRWLVYFKELGLMKVKVIDDKLKYLVKDTNKYSIGSRYFLLANRCKDKSKIKEMEVMVNKANELIKKNIFLKKFVEKFEIDENIVIPIKIIIDKLLKKQKLNQNEMNEMLNCIWNIGFEELPMYEFNYKNSIHRGILITLMTYAQNTPLEPFFPLQNYPNEDNMVSEITQKWEQELIRVLDESK